MFENQAGIGEFGLAKDCKPDPEEMLQRARKRIEACDEAEKTLFALYESPVRIRFSEGHNDIGHLIALGSVAADRYEAKKQEKHWLAEIDS